MNKKEALRVLIKASRIFSDERKAKLLELVDKMTETQIDEWGKILADEQKIWNEVGN